MKEQADSARELATQLRCPSGTDAHEFGKRMYESNRNMIAKTLDFLQLQPRDCVLELGFGNGRHIAGLMERYNIQTYEGLELSDAMIHEASVLNRDLIQQRRVVLNRIEKDVIEKPAGSFDACFSVNTLYFWDDVMLYLNQIYRILKPGGQLVLTFIARESAEKLAFTQHGFHLHTDAGIRNFFGLAGFTQILCETFTEEAVSKDGTPVTRNVNLIKGCKPE